MKNRASVSSGGACRRACRSRTGAAVAARRPERPARSGLTDVAGIKVGHHTLTERPTGCTVILVEGDGAVGGVSQRGGAPGTRETDLLDPVNMVDAVNAIVLAGGSAYGLDAAQGVVRYLEEHKHRLEGRRRRRRADRAVGDPHRSLVRRRSEDPADRRLRLPGRGRRAATAPVAEGNVGAGAGATVGKLGGMGRVDERRHWAPRHAACPTASSSAPSSPSTPSATSSIPRPAR